MADIKKNAKAGNMVSDDSDHVQAVHDTNVVSPMLILL